MMKGPVNQKDVQPITIGEGISRKTVMYNDALMLCHFTLDKKASIALHNHESHQIGYVIRGRVQFITETGAFIAREGDSYVFDSYAKHGAICLEPAEVIEVFNPPRDDYQ
jgi:quercetin dioxygenase-like cupin family protein